MKLLHVADLHIGKIVNEFSMLEDQKYILEQILQTAIVQKVDAILIAGDLYDRSIPPADAVAVFDHFLTQALGHQIRMIMIAGNHDSQERVAFLEDVLQGQGLYISGVPKEELKSSCFLFASHPRCSAAPVRKLSGSCFRVIGKRRRSRPGMKRRAGFL